MGLIHGFNFFNSFTFCTVVLLIVFTIGQFSVVHSHETNMEKELYLTYEEKVAFDKFKSQVGKNLTHGFMKTDLFMLRWIRAKNLNVNQAVRDMFECLEWRRKNRVDTIHTEDWSDMTVDHPYRMDIIDKQGRPVALGSIGGQWNIRRSILQGRMQRLQRYVIKLLEEVFSRTYEINQKHSNITQFTVIASMEGFNVFQQACPLCLTTYVQLLTLYNQFYPSFAHAIISINTPSAFNIILDLVRPMLNKPTNEVLKIFGTNQKQWKPFIDAEIDENQVTSEFGGTKPDDYD